MLNNFWWKQNIDVQHAQKLHDCLNKTYEQNNVAEANLWVLWEISMEAFTKSTTQKYSALIKNSELFNGNCSKWKQFKQAVNNKLHHNTNHYLNHDDKIDYIDSYLNDKVGCVLNYKWDSNNHLDFETYLDLLSFFNKYYQNHLQDKTDMKEWKAFCMKHDDQFSVFWVKFIMLVCKIEVLFNNMSEQSVNLLVCQL